LGGHHFASGSNWVDAYANFEDTVAIRSDGTLWVSERPRHHWNRDDLPPPEDSPPLEKFGKETNWLNVARGICSQVVLLKRDGTLWNWGGNYDELNANRGLNAFPPSQLGADSDWTRILRGANRLYAWKRDGSAWEFREIKPDSGRALGTSEVAVAPEVVVGRVPSLDHFVFQSLSPGPLVLVGDVGVRDDGTLWREQWSPLEPHEQAMGMAGTPPVDVITQIGEDTNWLAAACRFDELVGLKTDGSLWRWDIQSWGMLRPADRQTFVRKVLQEPPVRLGTHDDWVALGSCMGEVLALAADGTLWFWPRTTWPGFWDEQEDLWLAPSKRPAKIENIFDASE
jgi:alpha-tubulin suppressor-like RCC1 family protein